jgi:hypothetical protein
LISCDSAASASAAAGTAILQLELFLAKASLQLQLGHKAAFADSLVPHISHLLDQLENNAAILAAATKVRC